MTGRALTEAAFQSRVIDTARLHGWLVFHPLPAMRRDGRVLTAMSGDTGFPDLVLAKAGRVMFRELKVDGRYPTRAQRIWLAALPDAQVWRPSDWPAVLAELEGKP